MWQRHLRDLGFTEHELSTESGLALDELRVVLPALEGTAYLEFLSRFGDGLGAGRSPYVASYSPRTKEWIEITQWFGLRPPASPVLQQWRNWQSRLPERIIPIGRNPGGAPFCLDLHSGSVWFLYDDPFPFSVDDIDRFAEVLEKAGVDASAWADTRVAFEYRQRVEHLPFEEALLWGDVVAVDFQRFAAGFRLAEP